MADLDTLRRDFSDTRAMMVTYGEWTPEQAAEVGAGIGEAVKSGDAGELAFWSDWMALRGEAARSLELVSKSVVDGLKRAA